MLGVLLGRSTILKYKIIFDDKDKVAVEIKPEITPVKAELLRLYGSYLAKIVYNFGGPNHNSSVIAIGALSKILASGIVSKTDCFKTTKLDDVIRFSEKPTGATITELSGTLYGWRNGNRSIQTNFPLKVTEQQTVFGSLALMQQAINQNKNEKNNLKVFQQMCKGMVNMFSLGLGSKSNDIVGIPTTAFIEATKTSA